MLAAGTASQASYAAIGIGIPVLAPSIRDEYDLTLAQVGVVLAAEWIGTILTLLAWGIAADRFGERRVLVAGLGGCGLAVAAAAHAPAFLSLVALIAVAGSLGGAVNSASGRAVMHWFGREERGVALGVRQTAVPVGGVVAALVLPLLSLDAAFTFLGVFCLAGAAIGGLVLREAPADGAIESGTLAETLRDRRLWRLCVASIFYVAAQVAMMGFVVLFLHDGRGVSQQAAAAVLAVASVLAGALRIGAGRWSDMLGSRLVPLRRVGVAIAFALVAVGVLTGARLELLVPVLVAATALSMGWNALSFTAAAELAGRRRSGAAIGVQQTSLSLGAVVAPVAFAAVVGATSWGVAFALAALGPLAGGALPRRIAAERHGTA